jgi:hypothetical protein
MAKHKIRKHDREAFEKIAKRMNDLLKRIKAYCPEANMYLEDAGNWNLINGPSHDEHHHPRHDRVEASAIVWGSGGAW